MQAKTQLCIAVLDDHVMSREALADATTQWPHGEVVLQATDGLDYEAKLAATGPVHLAIVDLFMPKRDGFETIEWIREHQPDTRILAITFEPKDEYVHRALLAGAHGIIGKACDRKELHAALDALRTTGRYANDLLMRQLTHVPDPNSPWLLKKKMQNALSPRELEFGMHYVSDSGPSRVAIAKLMKISEHTAESHRRNLVEKTGANTRLALLKCFIRFGLVKV